MPSMAVGRWSSQRCVGYAARCRRSIAKRSLSCSASAKLVMFADRLQHFPGAGQAGREGDEVARGDGDRRTADRRHDHFAGQEVAPFLFSIIVRELRDFLFPDLPVWDSELIEPVGARFMLDLDWAPAVILTVFGFLSAYLPGGVSSGGGTGRRLGRIGRVDEA